MCWLAHYHNLQIQPSNNDQPKYEWILLTNCDLIKLPLPICCINLLSFLSTSDVRVQVINKSFEYLANHQHTINSVQDFGMS